MDLWPDKKGFFFLGFIGYEYDKHDLGTDVRVAPAFCHATVPVGNEIKCLACYAGY